MIQILEGKTIINNSLNFCITLQKKNGKIEKYASEEYLVIKRVSNFGAVLCRNCHAYMVQLGDFLYIHPCTIITYFIPCSCPHIHIDSKGKYYMNQTASLLFLFMFCFITLGDSFLQYFAGCYLYGVC